MFVAKSIVVQIICKVKDLSIQPMQMYTNMI